MSAVDADATTEVVERRMAELMPDIFRYFYRRLPVREDAADAAAETLLTLWRKRGQLPDDPDEARRYAYGVAARVLLNSRRGARRREALRVQIESAVPVVDPGGLPDMDLRAALSQLPAADRELVLLVAWEGLGVAEAGRVLGLRPSAARARYSRARGRLRGLLDSSVSSRGR
ncbi:MAG: sigma-70 family RNA polymerase sigma factor [Protaetiibacter sp.]